MISIIKKQEFTFQLLCWAMIFALDIQYNEVRSTFSDCSIGVVNMFFTQDFVNTHNRYTNSIFHLIPLAWIKLGGNLKGLLILLSLSVHFTIFITTIAIKYFFRENKYGWFIILSTCFWLNHAFVYLTPESCTFIFCLFYFIFFDYYKNQASKTLFYMLCSLLFILAAFAHPISAFMIVLIMTYLFISEDKVHFKMIVITFLMLMATFALAKWMVPPGEYDSRSANNFIENLSQLKNIYHSALVPYFNNNYRHNLMYEITTFMIVLMLSYFKDWKRLLFFLSITAFLHVFLCIYLFSNLSATYTDLYYQCIGIIYCLFIFYCVTELLVLSYLPFLVLIAISCNRLGGIGQLYNKRADFIKSVITYCQSNSFGDKVFIRYGAISNERLLYETWALPFESLIFSTLGNKTMTISVANNKPNENTGNEFYFGDLPSKNQHETIPKEIFPLSNGKYYTLDSIPPFLK